MDARTDPLTLGVTLTVLGMGGTLLVLYILSLLVGVLKRLFPLRRDAAAASAPQSSAPTPPSS